MTTSVTYPIHGAYPVNSGRGGRSEYAQPRIQSETSQRNGQQFFVTEDEQCDCGRGLADQLRKHRQEQKRSASSKSSSKRAAEKKRSSKTLKSNASRSKFSSVSGSKSPCACPKENQKQNDEGRFSRLSKHLDGIEKAVADYAYQGAEQVGRALSAGRETLVHPLNRILGKSQERGNKSSASQSESESLVAESKSTSKRKQKTRFEKSARSKSPSNKKIPRVQTPGANSSKSKVGFRTPFGQAGVVKSTRDQPSLDKSSRSNSVSRSQSKRGLQSKRSVKENKRVCSSCRKAKPASEFAKSPASKNSGRLSSQTLVEPAAYSSSNRRGACKSVERSSRSSKAQRRSKKELRPQRVAKNFD
jgi:hypothetical protein